MSHLTLLQRKFVIEFVMEHYSSEDCGIQFDKTFGETLFFRNDVKTEIDGEQFCLW